VCVCVLRASENQQANQSECLHTNSIVVDGRRGCCNSVFLGRGSHVRGAESAPVPSMRVAWTLVALAALWGASARESCDGWGVARGGGFNVALFTEHSLP
jgi:hypothetical protein